MIYVGWWLIPFIWLMIYKRMLGRYPIDVVIYEKRGENIIKSNDVAGRFDSPINHYRLKKSKDTIPILQYDWVLSCSEKPVNVFARIANLLQGRAGSITLFKYGSKQYKPIDVSLKDGTVRQVFKEVKDNNGNPVWIKVYEPINPHKSLSNLTFDVVDWDDANHLVQEWRAIIERRKPLADFFQKYGVFIAMGFMIVGLIIAGYYYKEILLDAGSKYTGQLNSDNVPPDENSNINKGGNIPIIGDIITPPGT